MESILIRRHYITVTPTHTIPEVSSLPCTQLPPLNSSSVQNAAQTSRPNPGVVAAIALGAMLVILIMACAVAWVVCLKRKKVKMKREGRGRLHKHDYVFVQFPTQEMFGMQNCIDPLQAAAHSGLEWFNCFLSD